MSEDEPDVRPEDALQVAQRALQKCNGLEDEGKLTQQEIREETFLGQRTIYDALQQLEDIDAIKSHLTPADLRQTIYYVNTCI